MPDANDARLKLTPAQQRIYAALIRHRADLGEWYRAAIAVVNDSELPDRLSLAAHSFREVMEKLPLESQDRGADLLSKVRKLQAPWKLARQEQEGAGGAWNGTISEPLREFLDAIQSFFDGQAQLVNSRRDYVNRFLNRIDGDANVPANIQEERAKQWMGFHRYFDSVAHHKTVQEEEFRARMARFEVFIADRLSRPTDDFAAIDALLEED